MTFIFLIKKMWYISSMEYYSATKRNEIESPVEKWIDLESVIQSQDQYFLRYDISLYRLLAFPFRIGSRFLSMAYRILHSLALPPWLTLSPAILLLHHSHISLLVISQPDSLFPASESLHLLFPVPVCLQIWQLVAPSCHSGFSARVTCSQRPFSVTQCSFPIS